MIGQLSKKNRERFVGLTAIIGNFVSKTVHTVLGFTYKPFHIYFSFDVQNDVKSTLEASMKLIAVGK